MTVLPLRAAFFSIVVAGFTMSPPLARAAGPLDVAAVPLSRAAGMSHPDTEQYRQALRHADAGNLDTALAMARPYDDPLFADLVLWTDLAQRETVASFDEIAGFIRRNPDWPMRSRLLRLAEERMPQSMPPQEAVDWFSAQAPVSDIGKVRHAEAMIAVGRRDEGEALLRRTWIEGDFPADVEAHIRARHGARFSAADNVQRLDELLWRGRTGDARRQAATMGGGYEALADARIRLAGRQAGVDDAVHRVPASLQNDPGLTYERASWRRSRGLHRGVVELLDTPQATARKPGKWWPVRHWAVREAIRQGDPGTAYRLASRHGMSDGDGYSFSEAEWLAGWISLRLLRQPEQAWRHFDVFQRSVGTPVSLGRGAYWLGRAAEASGDAAAARSWYGHAAQHGTVFYGQLAAARLPERHAVLPADTPQPTAEARAAFDRRDPVRVLRLLDRLGERGRMIAFLGYLSTTAGSAEDTRLIAELASEVGHPSYGVHTARRVRQDGIIALDQLFPAPPLPVGSHIDKALVLSIIRQESSFDENAVSGAGARGLMQLMPATAQQVAQRIGVDHTQGRLTADPAHNLRLGEAYLAEMIDRFGGSWVLAIAAYNAGPGNVHKWIRDHGDPRSSSVDVLDWMERIPFQETRNYVQRIFEGLHVYRARLDPGRPTPVVAEELLAGAL